MTEEKTKKMCGVELEFPVMCHVKVIAEKNENMQSLIESELCSMALKAEVTAGNSSAEGKYVTYNFSFMADSKERMTKVDQQVRAIKGVKMVL